MDEIAEDKPGVRILDKKAPERIKISERESITLSETALCREGVKVNESDVKALLAFFNKMAQLEDDRERLKQWNSKKGSWIHMRLVGKIAKKAAQMINTSEGKEIVNPSELEVLGILHDAARILIGNTVFHNDRVNDVLLRKRLGIRKDLTDKMHSIEWLLSEEEISIEDLSTEQKILKLADTLGKFDENDNLQSSQDLLANYDNWLKATLERKPSGAYTEEIFRQRSQDYARKDKTLIKETRNWFNSISGIEKDQTNTNEDALRQAIRDEFKWEKVKGGN